jgi:acyl carrier protein
MTKEELTKEELTEDDTANRLARIWERLLSVESVGLDEDYFNLGGDSALTIQLFSQIEKAFDVKLPVAAIFEASTVRELAKILRENAQHSNQP